MKFLLCLISSARSRQLFFLLSLIFIGPIRTLGLTVTQGSTCTSSCSGPTQATNGSDIACFDKDYNTVTGITFANCVSCELQSPNFNPETFQSDRLWALCKNWTFLICSSPAVLVFLREEKSGADKFPRESQICPGLVPFWVYRNQQVIQYLQRRVCTITAFSDDKYRQSGKGDNGRLLSRSDLPT